MGHCCIAHLADKVNEYLEMAPRKEVYVQYIDPVHGYDCDFCKCKAIYQVSYSYP